MLHRLLVQQKPTFPERLNFINKLCYLCKKIIENLEEFYQSKGLTASRFSPSGVGHFNIFDIARSLHPTGSPIRYTRRNFYKICLIRGSHTYHYADQSIRTDGSTLMFFNPQVPYSFVQGEAECTGYFLIFKEEFLLNIMRESLSKIPVFAIDGTPNFTLNPPQDADVAQLFQEIAVELDSDYHYKYDIIKNRVADIIHYALKLEPGIIPAAKIDANTRLTLVFKEALERQFPVESPHYCIAEKTPADFAERLSVHVNHLNRAIKKTTGKTTTQLIAERIIAEAHVLLRLTDWPVSQIAYSLGFDEPSNFTAFFKKQTATTPSDIRLRTA